MAVVALALPMWEVSTLLTIPRVMAAVAVARVAARVAAAKAVWLVVQPWASGWALVFK